MKYIDSSLKKYLDELASDSPTPGGGGTSALVAALGIALVAMVARIGSRKLEGKPRADAERIIGTLEKLRHDTEEVIDLDPKVYQEVMDSYKRAKHEKDAARAQAGIETALGNSFRLQADLAMFVVMARELLAEVKTFAKGSIANDLIVADGLLEGAFVGAKATAVINAVYVKDPEKKKHFEQALRKLEEKYRGVSS